MKNVHISSLEGSEIYSHTVRGERIKHNYSGMIPFSLELMKLKSLEGFNIHNVKHSVKDLSKDIINVKFKQKVKSGATILEGISIKLTKALDELNEVDAEKKNRLVEYIEYLEVLQEDITSNIESDKWKELSNEELREYLYLNGFNIVDENGEFIHYVVYKRSSSKSRTGQCLFIKEDLHKDMMDWSRMGIDFNTGGKIDYASLLAYESLVGSSLEETISINPKNILIVDDLDSKFNKICNVVRTGENGFLDSFREPVEVSNSLFDGESLLQSDYFTDNTSMKLLRSHFFKSASFNCEIQKFFKDNEIETVTNMFGEPMLAKDVHMICTPSSLKALKFSNLIGTEKDMWNYWKELVENEGSLFGVCKHEKPSKRGTDELGNLLQQTSYQMLNSMPLTQNNVSELAKFEVDYIAQLKNDDETFIQYIEDNANLMNSNMMFVDVYKVNKDIVNTKVFRDFRKSEINKYVTHVKKGKVRLNGDYCVMLGNPMEFLFHVIGKGIEPLLVGNQIYTSLFEDGKELVGFRNPHTSPSNVLVAKNTYKEEFNTYFNLSNNIVVVNAIDYELQDILSGCDYDSDTVALFDNPTLLEVAKQCSEYNVCINKVKSDPMRYELNNRNMSIIDNRLSQSQKYIGRVVNLGQLCMSIYWDKKSRNNTYGLNKLMRKVDVMTVLSGIAIDMAKKMYDIEIDKEILQVEREIKDYIKKVIQYDKDGNKILLSNGKEKKVESKPLFFKYISQSKTIKNRVTTYDCPMDYLQKEMKLPYAEHHEDIEFDKLLVSQNQRNANRKQKVKISEAVEEMVEGLNGLYAKISDEVELNNESENIIDYYKDRVGKLTVKPDTMYALLKDSTKSKVFVKLLNMLYTTQKEVFLESFKK